MTGSILQLASIGAQNTYLTGNPQFTYFKNVYRRHTNFSIESIEQTYTGQVGFGNQITFPINRNGDLISSMYLEIDVKYKNQLVYERTGFALIDKVSIDIGGMQIDEQYGRWLNIWSQLILSKEKYQKLEHMIQGTKNDLSLYNNTLYTSSNHVNKTVKYYVPLFFWFNRDIGKALPLISLQYHEVKLNVHFTKKSHIFHTSSTEDATLENVTLYCDYIFLDTDERRQFVKTNHEYLIEQIQYQKNPVVLSKGNNYIDLDLKFNHPCKELIWELGHATSHHEEIHYSLINKQLTHEYASGINASDGKIRPLKSGGIIMAVGGSIHSPVAGENGNLLSLVDGTYRNVSTELLGSGTGTGLTVDLTVSGNIITQASVNNPGQDFNFPTSGGDVNDTKMKIDVTGIDSVVTGFSNKALLDLRQLANEPYYVGSDLDTDVTGSYRFPEVEVHPFNDWSVRNCSIRNTGTNRFNDIPSSSYIGFDNGLYTGVISRDLRSPVLDLTFIDSIEITFSFGLHYDVNFYENPDFGDQEGLYLQFSDNNDWENDNTFLTNTISPSDFITINNNNNNGNQNKNIQIHQAFDSKRDTTLDSFKKVKIIVPNEYRNNFQYIRIIQPDFSGNVTYHSIDNYAIYDIQFNYLQHRYFDNNYDKYFKFNKVNLLLNNNPRFIERDSSYFSTVQSYQHHTGAFNRNISNTNPYKGNFYSYSFALYPEKSQPSGTCNFSRIDNTILRLNITGTDFVTHSENHTIDVYTINYNVLRIQSGMGGLAYSN